MGKKPIGFINPTIYKFPGIFNDITEGGNQGCGTAGFQAVKGWDPVTGLGELLCGAGVLRRFTDDLQGRLIFRGCWRLGWLCLDEEDDDV